MGVTVINPDIAYGYIKRNNQRNATVNLEIYDATPLCLSPRIGSTNTNTALFVLLSALTLANISSQSIYVHTYIEVVALLKSVAMRRLALLAK